MEERKRKKWTPVGEPDEAVLKLREKRKWQIALRRYVIEENKCVHYAPYFGLGIEEFRRWIACQFTGDLSWGNFSEKWQLDHVIPVAFFDFNREEELRLCWSFLNIRVNSVEKDGFRSDLLSARGYFESILATTGLAVCRDYLLKIDRITTFQSEQISEQADFLNKNMELIANLQDFSAHDFQQINEGVSVEELLAEKTLLKNFG